MAVTHVALNDLDKVLYERLKGLRPRAIRTIQATAKLHMPRLIQHEISTTDPQPVSSGDYRRRWTVADTDQGATLYNPLPYAAVIEHGRRPGARMPPTDVIQRWVVAKRIAKPKEARSVAFLIARKIAKDGIPAKKVLERAVKQFRPILIQALWDMLSTPEKK